VVIEYARHVLGFEDAQHAEYDPTASRLFVNQLACSLLGKTMTITLQPNSRVLRLYGRTEVSEQYYCQFGLNPAYQAIIEAGGLHISGVDQDGEARILELANHPYFIATLFLPQLNSSAAEPHPLIVAYMRSAAAFQQTSQSAARSPLRVSTTP
jgi:CTP synthase (UTP-ammonia lyase)